MVIRRFLKLFRFAMRNSTNPIIIDHLLRMKIADLKKLGYFIPDGVVSGVLTWGVSNSIRAKMDNTKMVLSLEYVINGAFISRRALSGAMYSSQTKSKWDRAMYNGCLREDFVPYKRYGKLYYRGKLTPYGKRIERHQNIVDRAEVMLLDWLLRHTKISQVARKFHT